MRAHAIGKPGSCRQGPVFTANTRPHLRADIGVFVGRAVPVVGWVIAAKDVTMISIRSVSRYNALVKPEDKVF
ncbi:hypothetical protein DF160_06180 [Burkholderia anthina]|nr:hypothetical protein DF160_06180 [Burkholderia anthina]